MRLPKNNYFSLIETINSDILMSSQKDKDSLSTIREAWANTPALQKKDIDLFLNGIEESYKKGGLQNTVVDPFSKEKIQIRELVMEMPVLLQNKSKDMTNYIMRELMEMFNLSDMKDEDMQRIFKSMGIEEEQDINKLSDKDVANMILRYNQVVNRALRARFISVTRRKSL